ncbi:hypothetical protein [Kribbella koreensis]
MTAKPSAIGDLRLATIVVNSTAPDGTGPSRVAPAKDGDNS